MADSNKELRVKISTSADLKAAKEADEVMQTLSAEEERLLKLKSQFLTAAEAEVAEVERLTAAARRETAAKAEAAEATAKANTALDQTAAAASTAVKSLDRLEDELRDLQRQLSALPVGGREFVVMAGRVKEAEAALTKAEAEARKLGGTLGRRGNAGMAVLEFSRAFEDAQYGMRGVLNNIPGLVAQLGGTAGLAGAISIAAVLGTQLWERMGSGAEKAEDKVEKFKDILDSLNDTLRGVSEFNFELNTRDAMELMEARSRAIQLETTALNAANDAVKDRIEHERELSRIMFEAAVKSIDRAEAQGKLTPGKAEEARDRLKVSATEAELKYLKDIEAAALKAHQMKLAQLEKERESAQELLTIQSNALSSRQEEIKSLRNQVIQRQQLEEQRKSLEERISKEIKDSAYGAGMGPAAPVPGRDTAINDLRRQLEETNSLLGKFPTEEIAKNRKEVLEKGDPERELASLQELNQMVSGLVGKLESIDSKLSEQRQTVDSTQATNQREQGQRQETVDVQRSLDRQQRAADVERSAADGIAQMLADIVSRLGSAANNPNVQANVDRLEEILKDGFQVGEQNEVSSLLLRLSGELKAGYDETHKVIQGIQNVVSTSVSRVQQLHQSNEDAKSRLDRLEAQFR